MRLSKGSCNHPRATRTAYLDEVPGDEIHSWATGRESGLHTYSDWIHHLSTQWLLCPLFSDVWKNEDDRPDDFAKAPSRVDSGVGLDLLDQDNGQLSHTATSIPPTPIALTFCFEDGSTTKRLDYHAFAKWEHVSALLYQLGEDGIIIHTLWDVNEDLPIGSGDWDARIQPGSVIEAWCFNDVLKDDWGGDSSGNESEDDMERDKMDAGYRMSRKGSVTYARNEHTWWFTRWRQRVEKEMPGRDEITEEPSWFFVGVWCTATISVVIIVSVLSL